MTALTIAVQLVAFAVGAVLQLALAGALLRKRRATLEDRLLTLALVCSAFWFASRAAVIYEPLALGDSAFVAALASAGLWAGLLAATLLVYVVMLWADLPSWAGIPACVWSAA